jgi:hypothetical protein
MSLGTNTINLRTDSLFKDQYGDTVSVRNVGKAIGISAYDPDGMGFCYISLTLDQFNEIARQVAEIQR